MATIERPKLKKKKQSRLRAEIEDTSSLSSVDIDFPTALLNDDYHDEDVNSPDSNTLKEQDDHSDEGSDFAEIKIENEVASSVPCSGMITPTTQLAVAVTLQGCIEESKILACLHQSQENIWQNDDSLGVEGSESEVVGVEEVVPSAPSLECNACVGVLNNVAHEIVTYPQLQSLGTFTRDIDNQLTEITAESIKLNPFTVEQIKELYHNPEQSLAELFEKEFISTELNEPYRNFLLYELLQKYSKSRYSLKISLNEVQNIRKQIRENEKNLWKNEKGVAHYSATARDGTVGRGSAYYDLVVFNEIAVENMSTCLHSLLNVVCFDCTQNSYACDVHRMQIEQLVREILVSCPALKNIETSTEIHLKSDMEDELREPVGQMRIAISILFTFLRKPSPDQSYTDSLRKWLNQLLAVYLRVATWQDHMFLLYHILRCPAGVATWAVSYIQLPIPINVSTPFTCEEINHCLTFLSALLLPTKRRNEFLAQLCRDAQPVDPVSEDIWILVDSDGEEGNTPTGECVGLKESDLVSFLNQIPIESIFRSMFLVSNNQIDKSQLTGHHLLKFIAFSTNFVKLLGEGLNTYNSERYKQFAKRLGRLARHTVIYVSKMNAIFRNNSIRKDPYLCARTQIEYDSFVLRASNYIYKSRYLGAWQYLATMPFSDLTSNAIWKLFYSLNIGFSEEILTNVDDDFMDVVLAADLKHSFNEIAMELPPEDLYYLLQTFSAIVIAREKSEWALIRTITLYLFELGFINEPTKELCYKSIKDLLSNVTSKYPELISDILLLLKQNVKEIDNNGPYLLKSLPLSQWSPNLSDFEILASWLLNFSFETVESLLARIILSRLNWHFDGNGKLFIPHDIHVRMACLIVDVSSKHVPECVGSSGISESVRQVSKMVINQTAKQQFTTWCWNMASVLRLHSMDQSPEQVMCFLRTPSDLLRHIPEVEHLQPLYQGVSEARPIALFLSILSTQWGHSVPQICHKGFQYMKQLLTDYRHCSVIRCLQLITPLFITCPESLSKCAKFQLILSQIFTSDKTYLKMAKDLISSDAPGPVLELFGNMIQAQLIDYIAFGLSSPTLFVNLWLQCLTEPANWFRDWNAHYLIDIILKVAYQFPDAWYSAKEYFRFVYKSTDEPRSTRSSFIPFLGGSQQSGPIPTPSPDAIWFALINLELEHEIYELQTKFWPEFLRQLQNTENKMSLDGVVKKSSSLVGCSGLTANTLVLYKWANLIVTCTPCQPLLPIICQKFYNLYLGRVPLTDDEQRYADFYGVADKFYEANIPLMKRLKKKFLDAENFYKEQSLKESDEQISQHHNQRSKIFRTYTLWLEETCINKMKDVQNSELPPQFELNKLALVFTRNDQHWTEYLYLPSIRETQREAANKWLTTCIRSPKQKQERNVFYRNSDSDEESSCEERILSLLKSYDVIAEPPKVEKSDPIINQFGYNEISGVILNTLKKDLKKLEESSKQFHDVFQEINSLDGNYVDLVRLERFNKDHSITRSLTVTNETINVRVKIKQPTVDPRVQTKIRNNRDRQEMLINKQLETIPESVVMSIVRIHHSSRRILELYTNLKRMDIDDKCVLQMTSTGIQSFYDIVGGMTEQVLSFLPAFEIHQQALSQFGTFILESQETQGINLLKTAFGRPHLVEVISEFIVPSSTSPTCFLSMYQFIVNSYMKKCDTKILFVLLSKFDICKWLQKFHPKRNDISSLIQVIIQGLECWNQPDTELIQGVLRRHLILLFEHDFPEHYGEVLRYVLASLSDKKLMCDVVYDIINSMYKRAGCGYMDPNDSVGKEKDEIVKFATKQKLLSHKDLVDTIQLMAKHFQNERLQHGLHGLYPKHKEYCRVLSLLFGTLGYSLIVAAVHSFPGILADQLIEWLWPALCDLYSPWIVPYFPQSMPNPPANWITQVMSNNPVLLPWSDPYKVQAESLIHSFVNCIHFILEMLPTSGLMLCNIFHWYEMHFAKVEIPKHIIAPVNAIVSNLSWDRFRPGSLHIEAFYKILQQFIPDCHAFIGRIFLRIPWTLWLQQNYQNWDFSARLRIISPLLMIFVKLSYEPHVRENLQIVEKLREACNYPWQIMEHQHIEAVLDWFVMSTEPSVILKLSAEHKEIDTAVLELLQAATEIKVDPNQEVSCSSQSKAKRILYVRSIVRLLRSCGSKYQQLLNSRDGVKSFHSVVTDLLFQTQTLLEKVENPSHRDTETKNIMMEIIGSLQTQSEFTSKLFVQSMIIWQSTCPIGDPILCNSIDAIGKCKQYSYNISMLLEATIFNYFKSSPEKYHKPTWINLMQRLQNNIPLDLPMVIRSNLLLCVQTHVVQRLKSENDNGQKIAIMQNIQNLLDNQKIDENSEAKLMMLWCVLVSGGCQLTDDDTRIKFLLTLARYFQTVSSQAEGWSDGLLGAIGLKKGGISNKRRVLMRSFATFILAVVNKMQGKSSPSMEYQHNMSELKQLLQLKKYLDQRNAGYQVIDIIENRMSDNATDDICLILKLFYNEPFLVSIEDLWIF